MPPPSPGPNKAWRWTEGEGEGRVRAPSLVHARRKRHLGGRAKQGPSLGPPHLEFGANAGIPEA